MLKNGNKIRLSNLCIFRLVLTATIIFNKKLDLTLVFAKNYRFSLVGMGFWRLAFSNCERNLKYIQNSYIIFKFNLNFYILNIQVK